MKKLLKFLMSFGIVTASTAPSIGCLSQIIPKNSTDTRVDLSSLHGSQLYILPWADPKKIASETDSIVSYSQRAIKKCFDALQVIMKILERNGIDDEDQLMIMSISLALTTINETEEDQINVSKWYATEYEASLNQESVINLETRITNRAYYNASDASASAALTVLQAQNLCTKAKSLATDNDNLKKVVEAQQSIDVSKFYLGFAADKWNNVDNSYRRKDFIKSATKWEESKDGVVDAVLSSIRLQKGVNLSAKEDNNDETTTDSDIKYDLEIESFNYDSNNRIKSVSVKANSDSKLVKGSNVFNVFEKIDISNYFQSPSIKADSIKLEDVKQSVIEDIKNTIQPVINESKYDWNNWVLKEKRDLWFNDHAGDYLYYEKPTNSKDGSITIDAISSSSLVTGRVTYNVKFVKGDLSKLSTEELDLFTDSSDIKSIQQSIIDLLYNKYGISASLEEDLVFSDYNPKQEGQLGSITLSINKNSLNFNEGKVTFIIH
ncbi:hypothetical protein SHELI_v1c11080 [Spiroplasma helicoides]|uniref:Lipoprotein n=1 Tax=Spiroplasma helicoides TaxID=216938 RepID=A0A1B3SM96_9MOLU|nr:hypothetical protein [Spiroplasma helicoides]AOG61055.1 hypothetical protein SHELI_v1c11080 [Spiroplasma helicoides]